MEQIRQHFYFLKHTISSSMAMEPLHLDFNISVPNVLNVEVKMALEKTRRRRAAGPVPTIHREICA